MKDPHISIGRAAVETVTDFEAYSFEIGKAVEMRQGSDLPLLPAGSPWARPRGGEHISGGRRADKGCPICIRSPIDREASAAARETKHRNGGKSTTLWESASAARSARSWANVARCR